MMRSTRGLLRKRALSIEPLEKRVLLAATLSPVVATDISDVPAYVTSAAAPATTTAVAGDDRFEPNNSFATATNLGTVTKTRTIENLALLDGADWYRFTTTHTGESSERVLVLFQQAQGDLRASLFNAAGQLVRNVNTATNNETVSLTGLPQGQYFLRITGQGGATNPAYSLRLVSDDQYEPNDSYNAAADLGLINQRRTFSDLALKDSADWFKFRTNRTLTAAEKLVAVFANAAGNLDLALFDANRQLIKSASTNSNNEVLGLAGFAPGTYYIRVLGRAGATNGNYALDFRIDDAYENNDSRTAAKNLGVIPSSKTISNLSLLDTNDWYKFKLNKPASAESKVTIQFSHAQGNLNAELYLNGVLLRSANSTTNNEVIFLQGFGTLELELRVFGQTNPTYRILIENPFDDAFENNDTQATAASVSTGGLPFDGKVTLTNLVSADPDWFYFASESVAVGRPTSRVQISFNNSQGDLDLFVYNAAGTLVGKSTGTGNSETVSLNGVPLHGPNGERLRFSIRVIGKGGVQNDNYTLSVDTGFIRA